MKTCSTCRVVKEDAAFAPSRDRKSGLSSQCRACRAEAAAKSRDNRKDKIRATGARWRAENREHLKARGEKRRRHERAKCMVAAARVRARKHGLPFSLTAQDIARIQAVLDTGYCEMSGVPFTFAQRTATTPSLDRIVPSAGYVPGNVRVVCHCLNAGMGDWGEDAFLDVVAVLLARRGAA